MTVRKDKEAAGIATRNDALIVAERIAELRRRRKAHAETAPYRFMTEGCMGFAAIGGSVANAITSVQKDSMVMQLAKKVADMATTARGEECGVNVTADGRIVTFLHDKKRTSVQEYKIDSFGSYGQSVISSRAPLMYDECLRIRKLTERECFRLMNVSETDIDKIQAAGISRTQQYKMAGNSIVVAVLYHIFRKMFIETECETKQLKLF